MLHANTFFNRSSIEIKVSLILLSILLKTSPFPNWGGSEQDLWYAVSRLYCAM